MIRAALAALAVTWCLAGMFIVVRPQDFYDIVPGLATMGPFNSHFIRDTGLAFAASGAMLGWGTFAKTSSIAFAALMWPVLHGVFHLHIWGHRGFPIDRFFAFDLAAVIAPPAIALVAIRYMVTGPDKGQRV